MTPDRLDSATAKLVKTSWASLIEKYKEDPTSGQGNWTDSEADSGFLKNVDALNTLVEPFLLAPNAFVDPPMPLERIEAQAEALLGNIGGKTQKAAGDETGAGEQAASRFLGFSASPYPYSPELRQSDFVDSAASVLRLACNLAELAAILRRPLSARLEKTLSRVTAVGTDFLLAAKVEDERGVRWHAFAKETDPPGKFANLFFTHRATMVLHKALTAQSVRKWIREEQREQVQQALQHVPTWVIGQYDPGTKGFWMDANKAVNQPMGVAYALEMIYTLVDPLPRNYREACAQALGPVVSRMSSPTKAQELQTDFYHLLPFQTGTMFYDDRGFIGSFLSLFCLVKEKNREIVSDSFIRAGEFCFKAWAVIGLMNHPKCGTMVAP